jgi:hypothetical protein
MEYWSPDGARCVCLLNRKLRVWVKEVDLLVYLQISWRASIAGGMLSLLEKERDRDGSGQSRPSRDGSGGDSRWPGTCRRLARRRGRRRGGQIDARATEAAALAVGSGVGIWLIPAAYPSLSQIDALVAQIEFERAHHPIPPITERNKALSYVPSQRRLLLLLRRSRYRARVPSRHISYLSLVCPRARGKKTGSVSSRPSSAAAAIWREFKVEGLRY